MSITNTSNASAATNFATDLFMIEFLLECDVDAVSNLDRSFRVRDGMIQTVSENSYNRLAAVVVVLSREADYE
jgi:hypothetical protein